MDTTQHTPADVRGRIIRASILPIEDEETMIARLRAGAEAVERGELDAEDFAGVWSQYLRQLLRASSVPAPADVRERAAKTVYLWEVTRFGAAESWALRSWEQESNTRRELYFNVADRILALLRAPRGEGEADAESGGDVTVSQLLAVLDEYNAGVFCMTPENADGTPMFSVAVARGESAERLKQWANEDAEESAALRSEAQGEVRETDLVIETFRPEWQNEEGAPAGVRIVDAIGVTVTAVCEYTLAGNKAVAMAAVKAARAARRGEGGE